MISTLPVRFTALSLQTSWAGGTNSSVVFVVVLLPKAEGGGTTRFIAPVAARPVAEAAATAAAIPTAIPACAPVEEPAIELAKPPPAFAAPPVAAEVPDETAEPALCDACTAMACAALDGSKRASFGLGQTPRVKKVSCDKNVASANKENNKR